jgi:hypothetical protein
MSEPRGNHGYGYPDADAVFDLIDPENPPIGDTFKIAGYICELVEVDGKLEFHRLEEQP